MYIYIYIYKGNIGKKDMRIDEQVDNIKFKNTRNLYKSHY